MRCVRSVVIVAGFAFLTVCAPEPGRSTSPTSGPADCSTNSVIGDRAGSSSVESAGDEFSAAREFVETFDGNVGPDRLDTGGHWGNIIVR